MWDPISHVTVGETDEPGVNLFCAGHVIDAYGRVIFAGGTDGECGGCGGKQVTIYDPLDNSMTDSGDMDDGRWYPTVTTDASGYVYIFSGNRLTDPCQTPCPRNLSIEGLDPSVAGTPQMVIEELGYTPRNYPRNHLLSTGEIASVAPLALTYWFDPDVPEVREGPEHTVINKTRSESNSVLLPIDMWEETPVERILLIGGYVQVEPPPAPLEATDSCEILVANVPEPEWSETGDLNSARAHANAVLLADGNVFLIGGGTAGEQGCPIFVPELFNKGTSQWTALTNAPHTYPRMYHSVALLLLDGSVWCAGQNENSVCPYPGPASQFWEHGGDKAEIYYPPYYDDDARPVITSLPGSVAREADFDVEFVIDEQRSLDSIALISLSAVTHSVNMTQRYLILRFEPDGTYPLTLAHVEAPPFEYAPPGPYMLVVIDDEGIPSVAKVIYLE